MTLVQCPLCQKKIRVTEKISGRKVRCKCNNVLRMPKLPDPPEVSGVQEMIFDPEVPSQAPPIQSGPPIMFGCPSCSAELQVKVELAGKVARCRCGTRIQVPMPVEAEPLSSSGLEPLDGQGDALFDMPANDPFATDPFAAPDPYASADPLADDDLFGPTGGDNVLGGQPAYLGGTPTGNPYRAPASSTPKKKRKRKPKKQQSQNSGGISIDSEVIGGVLAMIGAVVWFGVGLAGGIIFFYPPILFCIGLAGVFKGLMDGD